MCVCVCVCVCVTVLHLCRYEKGTKRKQKIFLHTDAAQVHYIVASVGGSYSSKVACSEALCLS